ncbi:GNAT family N-acetyltransferase [Streptomyces mexicanus]|uniref:GNAT family N-acetyltransferase n=1 Tax=Streptomyces mexicanus TaxID=178566 RepID=UPI00364BADD2
MTHWLGQPVTRDQPAFRGLFLIARIGDDPVGCAAVRLLDDHTAEMYVSGEARGHGIGRAVSLWAVWSARCLSPPVSMWRSSSRRACEARGPGSAP